MLSRPVRGSCHATCCSPLEARRFPFSSIILTFLHIWSAQSARPGRKQIVSLVQISHSALKIPDDVKLGLAATVNVKPNLQIVADDVKCSHGCAVSDLEEEQLFYFRCAPIHFSCMSILHHSKAVTREAVSQGSNFA